MLRFLLLIVLVAFGAAAALFWEGSLGPLRAVTPAAVPGWASAMPDDAGLRQGSVTLDAVPGAPVVGWRLAGMSTGGPEFDLRMTAQTGADLTALAQVDWTGAVARLRDLSGVAPLAVPGDMPLGGSIRLDAGDATIKAGAAGRAAMTALSATGVFRDIRLGGAQLGSGPFALSQEGAGWRLRFSTDGAALTAAGMLRGGTGGTGGALADLDMLVTPGPDLTDEMRQMLDRSLPRKDGGWRVQRQVDLIEVLSGPGLTDR